MDAVLILAPVVITTAGAYLLGRRRALSSRALPAVAARVLECVGLTVVFLFLNTLAGALVTILVRALLRRFMSLYLVTDSVLVALSAVQAVALRWWWGEGE